MKKGSLFLIPLSISLIGSSLFLAGCGNTNPDEEEDEPPQAVQQEEIENLLQEIQQMSLSENDFSGREVDIFSDIHTDIPGEIQEEKIPRKENIADVLSEIDDFSLDESFSDESLDLKSSF